MLFRSKTFIFYVKQINKNTYCEGDLSEVKIIVRPQIKLNLKLIESVCEPEIINLKNEVEQYLFNNYDNLNISGIGEIEYFRYIDGIKAPIDAEKISYYNGKDSVMYIYSVEDAGRICKAQDTVWVVINQKPSVPIIENNKDSIFLCSNNTPLIISANNKNSNTIDTEILWENNKLGNNFEVLNNFKNKTYTAISINNKTQCKSDADSIVVVIADTIKLLTIGDNGVLQYCADETINLEEIALNSFIADIKDGSSFSLQATKNGFFVSNSNLRNINETVQDTSLYIFSYTDALTGCNATNSAKVIFHKLPDFAIDGETTICQGDTLKLEANGDLRDVYFSWKLDSDGTNISTVKEFNYINLLNDTTILRFLYHLD